MKSRTEGNLRNNSNLNNELDALQSDFQERNLEIQELKADNVTLSDLSQHRSMEISKIKNELKNVSDKNHKFMNEHSRLESHFENSKREVFKLNQELDNTGHELDGLIYKNNEMEKKTKELDFEKHKLEKQIANLHNANHSVFIYQFYINFI